MNTGNNVSSRKAAGNPAQRKGIWLIVIGLLFLISFIVLHLWKGIDDQGSLTLGIVFLIIGMMFYFIKSRENQISDEMQKKINALAMVMSFWVMLLVDVIAYMVHTWWRTLPLSITQVLGLFLFGNILLMCIFQWRYRTHTENLPF